MENKMKKRIIAIVAAVLALIILAVAILLTLSKCQGGDSKKDPPKKVIVVAGNNNKDDDGDDDDDDANKAPIIIVGDGDNDDGDLDDGSSDDTDGDDADQGDDNDDSDKGDDTPVDDDPYDSNDLTPGLGYTDAIEYESHELFGTDDETYIITSANGSDPLSKTFRGLTSTVYHPSEYLSRDPHERKYTAEMLDLELTRLKNSGFKFVRTMFWSNWMWTGDPNNPWDTETQTMLEFYEWCKKVDEYGLKVVPMMMWSYGSLFYGGGEYLVECEYMYPRVYNPDGSVKVSYDFGSYHTQMDHELQNERLAEWVATVAKAIKDHGVTNHFGFFFGNEPHEDGNLPMGAFAKWQVDTFSACEAALKKAGFRDKNDPDNYITLIGPNQSSPNHPAGLAKYFMENAPHVFDIYSAHFTKKTQSATDDPYDDAARVFNGYMETMDLFELRYEKEFWLDEFGSNGDSYNEEGNLDDPWYAVNIATQMIAGFGAGVSAISTWQYLDQTWPDYYGSGGEYEYGAQRSGCAPSLYKSEIPWSIYYTGALLAKFSGNENGTTYATKALDDAAGIYAVTVKLADGGWSILMVNMTTDEKTFTLNFEEPINATLYRYMHDAGTLKPTTAANVAVADKGFKNVQRTFSDTIPGGAVVAYSTMECFSNQ